MRLPKRAYEIIVALYERNQDLAEGNDDQRRLLTLKIAEQLCFELGNRWGTKSASPTRPPSKDSITFKGDDALWNWDWQNGTSRKPQVREGSEGENITGQHFIEVRPVDHLAEEPEPPREDIKSLIKEAVLEALGATNAKLDALLAAVEKKRTLRGELNGLRFVGKGRIDGEVS